LPNLILSFFVFIFLFLVFEFCFRFFRGKELYLRITTGAESLKSPYLFKPNTSRRLKSSKRDEFDVEVRINNFGFRGEDIEIEKEKGRVRIFTVGDSFTFGVGAEEDETIPFLLENNLRNEGLAVEVVNAGIGHSSPLSHYLRLRDIHLKFKPDLVVLLLDFSDLRDDWHTEKHLVYDRNGKILHIDPFITGGKRDWWKLLVKNSELCKYIHRKIVRTIDKIRVLGFRNYVKAKLEGKRAKAVISELDNKQANIDTIEYDQYLFIRGREKLPQISQHWQRTKKYLLMIRDLLADNNVEFILVTYPYGIHVGPDQWAEGRIYWGFEEGKTYTDRYAFDLIEDFAGENNILYIDTLKDFLEDKDKKLFFDLDGHLTPEGNRVLAGSIARSDNFRKVLNKLLYGRAD